MTVTDKTKIKVDINKKWNDAKTTSLKSMEEIMKPVKVTPPPKGKDNILMPCDSSMDKPSFHLSSKQIENIPELKPGDTMKIAMECTVKRCELNEDKSSDYRMEIDKLGIV